MQYVKIRICTGDNLKGGKIFKGFRSSQTILVSTWPRSSGGKDHSVFVHRGWGGVILERPLP